jgi:DUF971 family protein
MITKKLTRGFWFNYLMGMLKSDQHTDALEDWKYLEPLLTSYARIRDWNQYRWVLAIRIISSKSPAADTQKCLAENAPHE